jgi:hypothetical protein
MVVQDMVAWRWVDIRVWLCGVAGHRFSPWARIEPGGMHGWQRECHRCGLQELECDETGLKESWVVMR